MASVLVLLLIVAVATVAATSHEIYLYFRTDRFTPKLFAIYQSIKGGVWTSILTLALWGLVVELGLRAIGYLIYLIIFMYVRTSTYRYSKYRTMSRLLIFCFVYRLAFDIPLAYSLLVWRDSSSIIVGNGDHLMRSPYADLEPGTP
jgi:hypothetical protein